MDNYAPIRSPLIFAMSLLFSLSVAAEVRTLRGTVVDLDGKPISHAYVEVRPLLSKFSAGTVVGSHPSPWIQADQSGHFEIQLAPGRYRIQAKAETDGFPDPTFWLNIDPKATFPEVSVDNQDVTGVEVVLGNRGGILYGSVHDADTQAPIVEARVRLQDANNSVAFVDIYTNRAGGFEYAIPCKPVSISVTATGYKFAAPQSNAPITLVPGERRKIDFELRHE